MTANRTQWIMKKKRVRHLNVTHKSQHYLSPTFVFISLLRCFQLMKKKCWKPEKRDTIAHNSNAITWQSNGFKYFSHSARIHRGILDILMFIFDFFRCDLFAGALVTFFSVRITALHTRIFFYCLSYSWSKQIKYREFIYNRFGQK